MRFERGGKLCGVTKAGNLSKSRDSLAEIRRWLAVSSAALPVSATRSCGDATGRTSPRHAAPPDGQAAERTPGIDVVPGRSRRYIIRTDQPASISGVRAADFYDRNRLNCRANNDRPDGYSAASRRGG